MAFNARVHHASRLCPFNLNSLTTFSGKLYNGLLSKSEKHIYCVVTNNIKVQDMQASNKTINYYYCIACCSKFSLA